MADKLLLKRLGIFMPAPARSSPAFASSDLPSPTRGSPTRSPCSADTPALPVGTGCAEGAARGSAATEPGHRAHRVPAAPPHRPATAPARKPFVRHVWPKVADKLSPGRRKPTPGPSPGRLKTTCVDIIFRSTRRGGRAAQCTGLENRRPKGLVGSNPTPSAGLAPEAGRAVPDTGERGGPERSH